MKSNYLIKATYYNDHLDEDKDFECHAIVVAESYAEALQIFQEDLNCTIINVEVRKCILSNRIVWISEEEYDNHLAEELDEEEEDHSSEED